MKVYISGKIGTMDLTPDIKEKFALAEKLIQDIHKRKELPAPMILNPCSDDHQAFLKSINKTTYSDILMYDLQIVNMCDVVYILPDWQDSSGARAEVALAVALDKILYYITENELKKKCEKFCKYKNYAYLCNAEDIDATLRSDVVT